MTNKQIQIISTPTEIQEWVDASVSAAFDKLTLNSNFELPCVNAKPITTKELCSFLNISSVTCNRWRKKGKIPFMRFGAGSIRYDKAAVIAAIENKKLAR